MATNKAVTIDIVVSREMGELLTRQIAEIESTDNRRTRSREMLRKFVLGLSVDERQKLSGAIITGYYDATGTWPGRPTWRSVIKASAGCSLEDDPK